MDLANDSTLLRMEPLRKSPHRAAVVKLLSAFPDMSVLVAVDPESRFVEVVTGAIVRDHLDDQSCRLACLTMTSRFAIGDIAAGIRDGIIVLGDHARSLRVLHTDLPD